MKTSKFSSDHKDTLLELLITDTELAEIYHKVALEEAHLHGGEQALLNGSRYLAKL
jgi:hypothetical protein